MRDAISSFRSLVAFVVLSPGLYQPPGCGPFPLPTGGGEPGEGASPAAEEPIAAEVTTSDAHDPDATEVPPDETTFPLFATQQVWVYALYPDLDDGTYVQRTTFYTPDGAVYCGIARAFSVGPSAPATVAVSGLVGDLPVSPAVTSPAGPFVATPLSVSGTPISLNVVSGTWRAVVTLEGQPEPIGETTFDLLR